MKVIGLICRFFAYLGLAIGVVAWVYGLYTVARKTIYIFSFFGLNEYILGKVLERFSMASIPFALLVAPSLILLAIADHWYA